MSGATSVYITNLPGSNGAMTLNGIPIQCRWKGLQSLVQVEAQRAIKRGAISYEKRYYISSLPMNAERIGHAIRAHWRIENTLPLEFRCCF